jgi:hypothetical protein
MENYISQLEQEKMSLEREVSMNIFLASKTANSY